MLGNRTTKNTLLFMVFGTALWSPFISFSMATADPTEDPVAEVISTPVVAERSTESVSSLARKEAFNSEELLAKRTLEYFRAACDPLLLSEKSSGFSLFSNKNEPIYAKCLADLSRFERTYPGRSWMAEGLWRSSELERARKNFPGEVFALAKVFYLYDDATLRSKAENRLLRISADELKAERKGIKLLVGTPSAGEIVQRNVEMLQKLATFEGKEFFPLLRRESDIFLERYPAAPTAEIILALREETHLREKDYATYALGLRLMISLYPKSEERVKRLTLLGVVQNKELRDYKAALTTYEQLLRDYPKTAEAEATYLAAATIFDEELKNYPRAIELLASLVNDFPSGENARIALDYQARILAKKMKDPLAAINAYRQLVVMFPGKEAIIALGEAASLARISLQDYDEQIELQEELIKGYPESQEAVQALYDIAQTQEEKLKDTESAMRTYKRLVDLYPTSNPVVEKARKRLEKIQSK